MPFAASWFIHFAAVNITRIMFWKLTDADIDAAKAGDRDATERMYAAALPSCGQIAATIVGDAAGADRVLRKLVGRSGDQLAYAMDADVAGRWFVHQTVLLTRTEPQTADTTADTLMAGVGGPDMVAYQALVAGLRKLPRQQQEAFLLHHVHGWNPRLCAVAMDCSTQAVHTHLAEAERMLKPLADGHFGPLLAAMRQVHQTRPLTLPQTPARIARRVRRRQWGRRLLVAGEWLVAVVIVAAIAYGVWLLRDRFET